jgi:hypothetical protein
MTINLQQKEISILNIDPPLTIPLRNKNGARQELAVGFGMYFKLGLDPYGTGIKVTGRCELKDGRIISKGTSTSTSVLGTGRTENERVSSMSFDPMLIAYRIPSSLVNLSKDTMKIITGMSAVLDNKVYIGRIIDFFVDVGITKDKGIPFIRLNLGGNLTEIAKVVPQLRPALEVLTKLGVNLNTGFSAQFTPPDFGGIENFKKLINDCGIDKVLNANGIKLFN